MFLEGKVPGTSHGCRLYPPSPCVMSPVLMLPAVILQRSMLKPEGLSDMLCTLPQDHLPPGVLLLCAKPPPSPGRETDRANPMAQPYNYASGQSQQFPTFPPSSSACSHLCPEGQGGRRVWKWGCPGDPQLEIISEWLSGHSQPAQQKCTNSLGPPALQEMGAVTILFLQVGKQAQRH